MNDGGFPVNDSTCIKCRRNPARRIRLCIPCWALVVYGEPDRLPEFPPLDMLAPLPEPAPEYEGWSWDGDGGAA